MTITSALLATIPGLRHAFFSRVGGVSEGIYAGLNGGIGSNDNPAHVAENRRRMAEALGVPPAHFLTLHQVHSADVAIATKPWPIDARPRADASVTRIPGLALGVTAADCGPILFADPAAGIIGAAHAGWKGAIGGVIEATVAAMRSLGAEPARMIAAIGPLIRQPSYEVGPDFVASFTAVDEVNERYFIPSTREGHAMFDLAGFICGQLEAAGVGQIDDTGIDTYPGDDFYSYRRSVHRKEPDYGRHVHAIVLEK